MPHAFQFHCCFLSLGALLGFTATGEATLALLQDVPDLAQPRMFAERDYPSLLVLMFGNRVSDCQDCIIHVYVYIYIYVCVCVFFGFAHNYTYVYVCLIVF